MKRLSWLIAMALALPIGPQQRSLSLAVTVGKANAECLISTGPAVPISAIAFHPGGKMLAVGGYQEVPVWDLENGKLAARMGTGRLSGQVRALAFNKDGSRLAVAAGVPGASGLVTLFDWSTREPIADLEASKDEILAVAFSPDGRLLAAGGMDATVRVWSLAERKTVATLKDHTDWISGIAFSPDGKLMATSSGDKTVQVWDTASWKSLVSLPQTVTEPVHAVRFSPDGETLAFAVGGPEERAVRLWRTENIREKENDPAAAARPRQNIKLTRPGFTGGGSPLGLAWTQRIYVPCSDNTVKVMNANGGIAAVLRGHSDWVYSVAASADGARIASGSGDGTVKLWNAANGVLLATLVQLAPRADQWLILTPRGYFATSTAGAVRCNGADAKGLHNPDAVRQALAPPRARS